MNDDMLLAVADYTPDELFHSLSDDTEMMSVMDMSVNDLAHHGILGQKWGIRRFQPYQPGAKVKGGKEVGLATKVKQRVSSAVESHKAKSAAKAEVRAAKKQAKAENKAAKQQAKEEKKAADYDAAKKKAIESGSIEELAKFKGDLTNEEYGRAFMRLQNEKKMADMVAANQTTMWDKIDKGMEIVNKVSGYANTIATAKGNLDKLNDALHKAEKEAAKEQAASEKNKFITNIDSITELNRGMDKHKLTPQEYQQAMNILANKKSRKAQFGKDGADDEDFVDQDKKAARERAAKEQADRDRWTAEQNFKDFQRRQAKEAKRQAKEAQRKARKEANAPKDGDWWSDEPSSNKTGDQNSEKTGRETREKQEPVRQLLLGMKDETPSAEQANRGKRIIRGYDTSKPAREYDISQRLEFGNSSITRATAKRREPSDTVKAMRKTVSETALESARQKELDKKRRL